MKILYTTDLHGYERKYQKILDVIDDHDLLIIGSDILPKHQSATLFRQQYDFLISFLPGYLKSIKIPVIIDFGNDDIKCLYSYFINMIQELDHVYFSHLNEIIIDDISFIGMHFVPDYPFGLKDWCRQDGDRYEDPIQYMRAIQTNMLSDPTMGYFSDIKDLHSYFEEHISIQDALQQTIPTLENVIYLMHAPPKTLGLDMTGGMEQVGSIAITDFLLEKKPMLSLHGHIHESPQKTNIFINSLTEGTIQIQPGQRGEDNLVYCDFDTEDIASSVQKIVL